MSILRKLAKRLRSPEVLHYAYASGLFHPPAIPVGNNRIMTRTIHNFILLCIANDKSLTPSILLTGCWERNVGKVLLQYLPRHADALVVEVGANIGYHTILGSKALPAGEWHAFEAVPEVYEVLCDNILLNNQQHKIKAHNLVVVESGRSVEFSSLDTYKGAGSVINFSDQFVESFKEKKTTRTFAGICLDEMFANSATLDLLKIDAEGAEPLVMAGAKELLARSRKCAAICEFNRPTLQAFGDPLEFPRRMLELGFQLAIIDEQGGLRSAAITDLAAIDFCEMLFHKA